MQYKMDIIKGKAAKQRDTSVEGRSEIIVDESELNYNLDEVDTYFRNEHSNRGQHNYRGLSSISSSSCYGGSGSLDDLVSRDHDFSSNRSVSGKSESSLAVQSNNAESATNVVHSEPSVGETETSCSMSDQSTSNVVSQVVDCEHDINVKLNIDTPINTDNVLYQKSNPDK